MYAIETGFFPFAAVLVGAALFAIYRWVLRMKSSSRWAQVFILIAMLLTLAATFVRPVKIVEVVANEQVRDGVSNAMQAPHLPTVVEAQTPPLAPPLEWKEAATHERTAETNEDTTGAYKPAFSALFADAWPLLGWFYLAGVAAVILWFFSQLIWLYSLRSKSGQRKVDGIEVYELNGQSPFSFGSNIFLPTNLDKDIVRYVLLHEQAHVRHRHFLKLCALQLLAALCWFNPFVWLLFGEMRLQQELEVDNDVLSSGIDREQYQLSLLRVCTQEGKWILTRQTYGLKPLKQRIIFMNKTMNKKSMRRHELLAVASMVLVMTAAIITGCQTNEKKATADNEQTVERHHPMLGCWTMDWISNTGSGVEVHPMAMHYGFYNDSTFLCFSYWSKKGVNLAFSISGEGYTWQGDSLLDAAGNLTDYTLSDDGRTALSRWLKDSTQMAGVSGPDITEQWSRIAPNKDLLTVFRAVTSAKANAEHPIDGVWQNEDETDNYCLVNDSIIMVVSIHPTTVAAGFRYGGSGFSRCLNQTIEGFEISQTDNDHLSIAWDDGHHQFTRIEMPPYLWRVFSPALSVDEE